MTYDGMDNKDLDQTLAELRRSYNVPPERVPADEMWGRIERARWGRRRAVVGARAFWWIGMAATLLIGVGIGRFTRPTAMTVASAEGAPPSAFRPPTSEGYDRSTARYLGQTAALLIALPAEARAGRTDQRFVARAAELLTTTRLLLDSPAATDPKVRALLEDVELVLAQVAHLESDRGRVEFELIAQALEQRDLLPRLTSAVASGGEADD
jgi:hypothetical protein